MPPKASPKGKAKNAGPTLTQYCEVLKGTPLVNETTGKPVKKGDAAFWIWSGVIKGDAQREEVFKAQCLPNLVKLLESGCDAERFAAAGVFSALVLSEKHIDEVVSRRVINGAAALLAGDHDRARVPAAQFLAYIAQRSEYANKVADAALPALTSVLLDAGPGWAQTPVLLVSAAAAVKALIENVTGESADVKAARRAALLAAGAVAPLVAHACGAPRLPQPGVVPVPPPAAGKKGKKPGAQQAAGKAKGKGKAGGELAGGMKDTVATSAASVLRFLAACPGFVEAMNACGALPRLVDACLTAAAPRAAYLTGILWEVCSDETVARAAVGCGAVPVLLHVASRFVAAAGGGKKKAAAGSKDKKGAAEKPKPKGLEPPPPPNFADVAVCSACGALHHLTFLDEAKLQLGELGSVGPAILVAASRTGNPTTYENATGALWNVGLDVSNTLQLRAAAAPAYLAVPAGWLTDSRAALGMNLKDDDEDDEDDEEGGAGGADDAEEYPSTTFLTAPGAWAPQPPGLVAR